MKGDLRKKPATDTHPFPPQPPPDAPPVFSHHQASDDDALLPASVVHPLFYEVHLAVKGAPEYTFEGSVDILVEVRSAQSLSSLCIHATNLHLNPTVLVQPRGVLASIRPISRQVVAIDMPPGEELGKGRHTLRLTFAGSIGSRSEGVYACAWAKDESGEVGGTGSGQGLGMGGMVPQQQQHQQRQQQQLHQQNGHGKFQNGSAAELDQDDDDDSSPWILATHFEPANCRRVFPSFDLAHFKAQFRLTLLVKDQGSRVALSNTEQELSGALAELTPQQLGEAGTAFVTQVLAKDQQQQPPQPRQQYQYQGGQQQQQQWHLTRFEATPPVSTYVLGFWVGHFHCVEYRPPPLPPSQAHTHTHTHTHTPHSSLGPPSSLPLSTHTQAQAQAPVVRVHLPPHRSPDEGRFALDVAQRSLSFFSRLFQLPFPLRKLDCLCLPQM